MRVRRTGLLACLVLLACVPPGDADGTSRTEALQSGAAELTIPAEGAELAALLWPPTAPSESGPYPAVVLAHDSGPMEAHMYADWARYFSCLGFTVMAFDKRGVGESDGRFPRGRNGRDFEVLAGDVVAAIEVLAARSDIDRSRIGIVGFSQGGWVAPIAASRWPELRFLLFISGPAVTLGEERLFSRLTGDDFSLRSLIRRSREEISQELARVGPHGFDPVPFLLGLDLPALWIYGEEDESIPVPESIAVLRRLRDIEGRRFEWAVIEGADHGLRIEGRRASALYERIGPWLVGVAGIGDGSTASGCGPDDSAS